MSDSKTLIFCSDQGRTRVCGEVAKRSTEVTRPLPAFARKQTMAPHIYLQYREGDAVDPHADNAAKIPKGHNETILIVEDEISILKLTRIMLERLGYTVLSASTSSEAMRLAAAHAGKIHLLITDVVMPEMNGGELAERLRSLEPNLNLLFMSGYTSSVIAHLGVLDRGLHFIQKPFTLKDLATKVREALGQP